MQAEDAKEQLSNLEQKPTTGIAKLLGYTIVSMVIQPQWWSVVMFSVELAP